MGIHTELKHAGILAYTDAAEQIHLRYLPECKLRARRFAQARTWVSKLKHRRVGCYPARLAILELVQPHSLSIALENMPYREDNAEYIDWEPSGQGDFKDLTKRLDMRQLCNLTTLSIPTKAERENKSTFSVEGLVELLHLEGPYKDFPKNDICLELQHDMYCWATRHLPGPLWSHILGLAPIWCTTRETNARLISQRTLPMEIAEDHGLDLQVAAFMDAAQSADVTGKAAPNSAVLVTAIGFISFLSTETADSTLQRWLKDLLSLKTSIQFGNAVTAMVVAWMVDLVESGTNRKPDATPETRARYIHQAVQRIWSALVAIGGTPTSWTPEQLQAAYTATLADPTCSDKRGLAAGIASFQAFVHETYGLPLVRVNSSAYVPPSRPRIQVVHRHEVDLALAWLDGYVGGDGRVLCMSATLLALLADAPFRIDEAHWLRLENVKFNLDFTLAEVEIYRTAENPLKTASATRRLTIRNRGALARLRSLIAQRKLEGAKETDLVFGNKAGGGLYRKALVTTVIRRVLKAATGDDSMTIHALRHTYATHEVGRILTSIQTQDTNRLIQVAEEMGHVSISTTMLFYTHVVAGPLRYHLDILDKHFIHYNSSEAANVTDLSPENIRKRSSTKHLTIDAVVESETLLAATKVTLDPGVDTSTWIMPTCPRLNIDATDKLTVSQVLEIVASLGGVDDPDIRSIAQMHSVQEEVVNSLSKHLLAAAHAHSSSWTKTRRFQFGLISTPRSALAALDLKPGDGLQPKYHELLVRLASIGASDNLTALSRAVPRLLQQGAISLSDVPAATALFTFLQALDVTTDQFFIRVQPDRPDGRLISLALRKQIASLVSSLWNTEADIDIPKINHGGRPLAYLLWPSGPKKRSSREVESGGLQVLLLCARLLQLISQEGQHNAA